VKFYMYQTIKAIDHMHRRGIFHRDIKPENILIKDDRVKLADFGSCRGIYSQPPFTEYISTRWYRPPECLLTDGYYSHKMDIWAIGCVFFEIFSLSPLFPGNDEVDQVHKIHNVIGSPPIEVLQRFQQKATHMDVTNFPHIVGCQIDSLIPKASQGLKEVLNKLLAYQADERASCSKILKHPYFKELRDADLAMQNPAETMVNFGGYKKPKMGRGNPRGSHR